MERIRFFIFTQSLFMGLYNDIPELLDINIYSEITELAFAPAESLYERGMK